MSARRLVSLSESVSICFTKQNVWIRSEYKAGCCSFGGREGGEHHFKLNKMIQMGELHIHFSALFVLMLQLLNANLER